MPDIILGDTIPISRLIVSLRWVGIGELLGQVTFPAFSAGLRQQKAGRKPKTVTGPPRDATKRVRLRVLEVTPTPSPSGKPFVHPARFCPAYCGDRDRAV